MLIPIFNSCDILPHKFPFHFPIYFFGFPVQIGCIVFVASKVWGQKSKCDSSLGCSAPQFVKMLKFGKIHFGVKSFTASTLAEKLLLGVLYWLVYFFCWHLCSNFQLICLLLPAIGNLQEHNWLDEKVDGMKNVFLPLKRSNSVNWDKDLNRVLSRIPLQSNSFLWRLTHCKQHDLNSQRGHLYLASWAPHFSHVPNLVLRTSSLESLLIATSIACSV